MKRIATAVALAFAVASAGAQQRPSDEETNARINVLAGQRNQALDTVVILQARVAVLENELAKARDACKKEKPKE